MGAGGGSERREVGGVAGVVAHLPAHHPLELGMTQFLRHSHLSALPIPPCNAHKYAHSPTRSKPH